MLRRIGKASFLLFLLSSILFSPSIGGDTLTPDQPLADGGSLISAGGSFVLGFFSPDGSNNRYIGIWYHKISVQTSVWVANRQRPVTGGSGRLSVKTDGTLVLTDENSTVTIWSSSSPGLANPVARLLDNGNFVVVEAGTASRSDDPNSFAWQSFDYPTDTLLPGMKLGWNLTSGLNRNLTAWATGRDPAPGDYTVGIDLRGDPQLFVWFGTLQSWRGGPWNGLQFSGTGGMNADYTSNVEFVVDPHQVVYSFYPLDPSIITRLVMHQSGILQRLVWIEGTESWNVIWIAPKDQCDDMLSSPCGANGVCDVNNSPYCSCLSGFSLDSPGTSDGYVPQYRCMRSTALDCRNGNGTDGFMAMGGLKLPDTSTSMVHRSMNLNLEQCRALCLRNCSCTAFASANVSGSGSGCIIWTGELTDLKSLDGGFEQDLYVRLAAADLVESKNSQWSRVVVITVVPALAVFLLACVACCVWRRKKRKHCIEEDIEAEDLDLPLFDLSAIVNATGNFSIENKLGQGGFGPVYKGKLEKEQDIAVKRLSKTSMQGVDEFKNEVMLIAKLQHRNLVRLIGCCIQGGERILIYEYMPNGSLDAYLFDKAKGALLDWQTRYDIMIGIARGLLYLHHDSRLRIIHRDLKTSNILLDNNMNPKISDFGMARIFGADEIEINTKRVVGTYGYMSPEYAMDGIFSIKSDVFSFGVLMLEIISGKRNRGVYHSVAHLNLLGHIWSLWKEGKSLELVDTSIGQSFSMTEVLRCIKIGLLCVQEWPTDRPTMSSVVVMLGSDSSLLPEPKQPGFIDSRGPPDSSSNKKVSLSANKVSVTVLEGR